MREPAFPLAAAPHHAATPGWFDRCLGARDRLLASPAFQRWASGFPLTRRVAHNRAMALFDLCAGFVYSQVLFACVKLRLFEILAEGPQTQPVLAGRLSLPPEAAERLLDAAASLRLVERRRDGRFGLGHLGAALVGNPAVAAMIEHHAMLYADLRDPVALLRGEAGPTELARYWPYASSEHPSAVEASDITAYTALMSASQTMIADDILDAYPLERHRCLLDLGGGDGTFLAACAARHPDLRVLLFDLPAVAERARARFEADGLSGRAIAVGGDVFRDPLPGGADVVSLIRVIHDHDEAGALAILRAARRALPNDGILIVAEPMADTPAAERVGAYFEFYLLAMGRGRLRARAEIAKLLGAAGFQPPRFLPTRRPFLTQLLVTKPDGDLRVNCA